jgi:NAD(P)-dependent dehydrogenase (short-subunit alcohol dehydrogenase family)
MAIGDGELNGKVAIVTGSASGIGRETAKRLGAQGATVVVCDLPGTAMEQAAAEVAAAGAGRALHHVVDISDEAAVRALIAYAVDEGGRLDIVVNNAARQGLAEDADVATQDVAIWDSVFAVNARGTMLMCKHAVGPMMESGGGSIVNISSGTAFAGDFFATAYACTKGAILTLTKYVATQYAEGGVRCNAIAPGLIRTPALEAGMPEPMRDVFVQAKLSGRLGEPADIAEAVLFLAGDRSSFMTGQVLQVDGGFFAHLPTTVDEKRLLAQMGQGAPQ